MHVHNKLEKCAEQNRSPVYRENCLQYTEVHVWNCWVVLMVYRWEVEINYCNSLHAADGDP